MERGREGERDGERERGREREREREREMLGEQSEGGDVISITSEMPRTFFLGGAFTAPRLARAHSFYKLY